MVKNKKVMNKKESYRIVGRSKVSKTISWSSLFHKIMDTYRAYGVKTHDVLECINQFFKRKGINVVMIDKKTRRVIKW